MKDVKIRSILFLFVLFYLVMFLFMEFGYHSTQLITALNISISSIWDSTGTIDRNSVSFNETVSVGTEITPLHFIWVHPYLANSSINQFNARLVAQEWMNVLPVGRYKLMFWTDELIRSEFPELVPLLSYVYVPAWISDLIRYQILLRYGGVYLDTDVRAVHDFTPLLTSFRHGFTVCQYPWSEPEYAAHNDLCESVAQGIIAVPANHPVVRCAVRYSMFQSKWLIRKEGSNKMNVYFTGPPLWTSCVKKYGNIAVLPSWTFLPCSLQSRPNCNLLDYTKFPRVYGMHEWAWSWS
jgi:hypothetical protein